MAVNWLQTDQVLSCHHFRTVCIVSDITIQTVLKWYCGWYHNTNSSEVVTIQDLIDLKSHNKPYNEIITDENRKLEKNNRFENFSGDSAAHNFKTYSGDSAAHTVCTNSPGFLCWTASKKEGSLELIFTSTRCNVSYNSSKLEGFRKKSKRTKEMLWDIVQLTIYEIPQEGICKDIGQNWANRLETLGVFFSH